MVASDIVAFINLKLTNYENTNFKTIMLLVGAVSGGIVRRG